MPTIKKVSFNLETSVLHPFNNKSYMIVIPAKIMDTKENSKEKKVFNLFTLHTESILSKESLTGFKNLIILLKMINDNGKHSRKFQTILKPT